MIVDSQLYPVCCMQLEEGCVMCSHCKSERVCFVIEGGAAVLAA